VARGAPASELGLLVLPGIELTHNAESTPEASHSVALMPSGTVSDRCRAGE
jgi:hypothetical protein